MAAHGGYPDLLDGVRQSLLVQCLPADLDAVRDLAGRPGTGVVLTTRDRRALRYAADTTTLRGRVLVDTSRYSGKNRCLATAPFDRAWLALQAELGLLALTDSGYLDAHDVAGLESVLERTRELDTPALATLALHPWWLAESGGLVSLLNLVAAADVGIAVALEHGKDPLGVQRTLRHGLARQQHHPR